MDSSKFFRVIIIQLNWDTSSDGFDNFYCYYLSLNSVQCVGMRILYLAPNKGIPDQNTDEKSEHYHTDYNWYWGGHEMFVLFDGHRTSSCWEISIKATNVNLPGTLEKRVGITKILLAICTVYLEKKKKIHDIPSNDCWYFSFGPN